MKKLLLLLVISFCGANAMGQIIYQSPQQHRQSSQQQQSQSTRTTAYYADAYGNYYKVPIRIQQQGNAWYVVEYYRDNGIGGTWQRLINPSQISRCNSALASNSLEKQFMYKAFFNTQTHYFDF